MIKSLKLKNWRSHKDSEFEFTEGTNVLVGRMGSGKSSAMDALCFALFGSFPALQRKEVELSEIIMTRPSMENEAIVEMEFSYNGKNYKVERKIFRKKTNQAKLYCNGVLIAGPKVSDVTKAVEREIELNYELFSRAVYSEQNQLDYFLRMTPLKRKEKFDELLELDKYEKARKSAVNVKNTLKKIMEERAQQLKNQREQFNKKELSVLEKEINALEEKIKKSHKEIEEKKEKLKEEEAFVKRLIEKREKFKSLKEKEISLKSRVSSWKEEIKSIETSIGKKIELISKENAEKQKEKTSIEIKEIEKKLLESREIESKIRETIARQEQLMEEKKALLSRIPPGLENKKKLSFEEEKLQKEIEKNKNEKEKIEKELLELSKKETALREKEAVTSEKREREKELLSHLEKASSKCPLCQSELSKSTREKLLEEKRKTINELKATEKKIFSEIKKLTESREMLEEKKNKIEKEAQTLGEREIIIRELKKTIERIERISLKAMESEKEKNALFEKKKEIEKGANAKALEEKEEALKRIEAILEGIAKFKRLKEDLKELEETTHQITALGFNEEKAMKAEREVAEKREKINSLALEVSSLKELLAEKEKRKKELNQRKKTIEELERKTKAMKIVDEKMAFFINSLKATQSELRSSLIGSINKAMDSLWKKLYPYKDYESAKIEISKGNYLLKAKTSSGKWINIEGRMSGGERSAAALTLRIAFSLVLARNLGWIILDEPTHNLDENAINKLSEMMRNELPKIVEQVFLITHSKEMEKAASGALYLLKKEDEKGGFTRAELLPLR